MFIYFLGCNGSPLLHRLFSSWGAWASHCGGFSCCKARVLSAQASEVAEAPASESWGWQVYNPAMVLIILWSTSFLLTIKVYKSFCICQSCSISLLAPGLSGWGLWALEFGLSGCGRRASVALQNVGALPQPASAPLQGGLFNHWTPPREALVSIILQSLLASAWWLPSTSISILACVQAAFCVETTQLSVQLRRLGTTLATTGVYLRRVPWC